MHRVISAFRLLSPRFHQIGPLRPKSDGKVPAEVVGDFLNAIYIAVEKLREFGLSDEDFGGHISVVSREPGEMANGRYMPKDDTSVIFYPPVRGAPDWPWTIIHEIMHRIWVKHLDDDSHEFWETVCQAAGKPIDASAAEALVRKAQKKPGESNLWFYFQKHFGKNLDLFRSWLQTRRVSSSLPSLYANTDASEAFAEVAADVILGRGHAGREIKRAGSVVRKVFLSLIEPLRSKNIGGMFEEAMPDKDENFLQTQVDFGYLRVKIPRWVLKNVHDSDIIQLEHRPHATVYYGADARDLPQIEQIVRDYGRSIRMYLGGLNIFEHPDMDVLYFELVGDGLSELHRRIARLPHTRPPTHPEYTPHLTVAYLKKGAGRKHIGATPFRTIISARGLTVIHANGAERIIRAVPDENLLREPLLLAGQ
jgi:hypothetical protein